MRWPRLGALVWISVGGCAVDADGADTETSGAVEGGSTSGSDSSEGGASTSGMASDTTTGTGPVDSSAGEESTTGTPTACPTAVEPSATVVITARGAVEGVVTDAGPVAFLGIPYAAPPVGEGRWAPPEDPPCWTETRQATSLGPQCAQLETPAGPVVGEEDCLQLNVWTPAPDGGGRPVLVFIHGGGNAVGSATSPVYDGARLAAAGDQVVVTINYRLGVLGWLTHPDLPAVNFGLRDQIAALQWVQDNAEVFGGDPARVTVFGESAGAVNTCTLLGAPGAEGLFRGAIMQSGACNHRAAAVYQAQMSMPFVEASGCGQEDDAVACLRALDAAALVATPPTGFPSVSSFGAQGWGPSIDPETLPMQTLDAMEAGTHNDVPVIIGANADETFRDAPELADEQAYVALITATFGPLATAVLEQYPAANYDSPRAAYVAVSTDARFVCTARRSLRAAAMGASPVFRYFFTHDDYFAPGGGETGAFHGLELVYVFSNFDAIIPGIDYPATPADAGVRDSMQALWSSFAADATPQSDPVWPVYDPETDPYLEIADPLAVGEGVRTEACDFWDGLGG